MLGAERLLANRQRALKQRLRLGISSGGSDTARQRLFSELRGVRMPSGPSAFSRIASALWASGMASPYRP